MNRRFLLFWDNEMIRLPGSQSSVVGLSNLSARHSGRYHDPTHGASHYIFCTRTPGSYQNGRRRSRVQLSKCGHCCEYKGDERGENHRSFVVFTRRSFSKFGWKGGG